MDQTLVRASSERAQFEQAVDQALLASSPKAHAMMRAFNLRSDSFTTLQKEVVDHYFNETPSNPAFCAQAVSHLVQRIIDTMQKDLAAAA